MGLDVAENLGTFDRPASRSSDPQVTGEEPGSPDKPSNEVAAALGAGGGVKDLSNRKRELLAVFESRRKQIESLLGTQIAPLIRAARTRTERSINLSTYTATVYLIVMSVLGVFIGGGAGLLVVRRIVQPIRNLKASADAIGSGWLEHRITIESDEGITQSCHLRDPDGLTIVFLSRPN